MPSTVTSILDGLSTSVAVKAPCRTVATTNITLAGLQTISGYTTVEGDRVLVVGQTNSVNNGIYIASTGTWTRAKDADGNRDLVQGTIVLVRSAGTDGAIWELTTANPIVIGTSSLTFELRDDPAITYAQTAAEIAASIVPTNTAYEAGNVLRFSADNTGVANSATAFRSACFSNFAGWVPPFLGPPASVPHLARAPAGRYALTQTVYVRSGVALKGDGMATLIDASGFGASASNVFQLGWGNLSGTPTLDGGGYPPELSDMFFLGGPSGGGACVHNSFPGCLIHDIWCSAAGLGVYLAGGYLYDSEFDLGLVGVRVGPSTNQTISNCRFFNPNFCIDFDVNAGGDIADMIISGCTFEYPQVAAIGIGAGTSRVRNLKVVGCTFTNNADYSTFSALVSIANENCVVTFEDCSFYNWKNYAFIVAAAGAIVIVKNCLFDGVPTHSAFTASATAKGFDFSAGTLIIKDCIARNLGVGDSGGIHDNFFVNFSGSSAAHLIIDGLTYSGIGASAIVNITNTSTSSTFRASNIVGDGGTRFVNNQSVIPLRISNAVDWVGPVATASSRDYVLVPYQQSSLYQITLTANQNTAGSGSYRKSSMVYVQKNNEFSGTFRSLVNQVTAIEGAAGTNPVLDIDVEFGSVGGGVDIAMSDSGSLAISWPTAYAFERIDVQLIQSG